MPKKSIHKIVDLDTLSQQCAAFKKDGKFIVQCHGCFDLIHPGHIKHFEAARRYGDVLVVTITEDKYVNKGPGRPIFNERLRAETIAALQTVDYVVIDRAPTAISAIKKIKPDFYVKGQDYKDFSDDITGEIANEKAAVEQLGGKLVFTEEIQFSSSNLINTHLTNEDDYSVKYLKSIRNKIPFKRIDDLFARIQQFRVLVVGDIILDEYQFVDPLGKSSKSSTITARMLESELYAGGVLAVANHIADFTDRTTLVSTYGVNNQVNYLEFIRQALHPKVMFKGIFTPQRPTTLKRRFIDTKLKHKIFESIDMNDTPLPAGIKKKVHAELRTQLKQKFDVIVIADFGHGLMDSELVKYLCAQKAFLAVNAQTNSANTGYNLLTKYPRCSYYCVDQEEARLATHDKTSDIKNIHKRLMKRTHAQVASITLGINGSLVKARGTSVPVHAPILSHEVVDTIGAGDAFLSITSLLAKAGASIGEIAFIGNAVGAMAVMILGNKSSIEKISLLKYLKTLLA